MDWDLSWCMFEWGSPIIPFFRFVRSKPDLSPSPSSVQPSRCYQFFALPLEIQRLIFGFCDPPTLFGLMHSSPYFRRECLPLFWEAVRKSWFHLEGIGSDWNGEIEPIFHCPEFASQVTQVEIKICTMYGRPELDERRFWDKVQEHFPSVNKVVLTTTCHKLDRDLGTLDNKMTTLMKAAPSHITPFIAARESINYMLWRIDDQGSWHLTEDHWTPVRVVAPPKKLPPGLLNDFVRSWRIAGLRAWEEIAHQWLREETYSRCPKHGLRLPAFRADRFQARQPWVRYVQASSHATASHLSLPDFWDIQPEVKGLVYLRRKRMDQLRTEAKRLIERLRARAGPIQSARFEEFKGELRDQMVYHGYLKPDMRVESSMAWGITGGLDEADYEEWEDENNRDLDDFNKEEMVEVCLLCKAASSR